MEENAAGSGNSRSDKTYRHGVVPGCIPGRCRGIYPSNLQSAVRVCQATGFYLKHIRDNELYLEAGYKNINEYAMDRFGLSASATSRYITRNTRFSGREQSAS